MIDCEQGSISPETIHLHSDWICQHSDHEIIKVVRMMAELSKHPYLLETHCGGISHFDSIQSFLEFFRLREIASASFARKQHLMKGRRKDFQKSRKDLELALIDRDGYVCQSTDCDAVTDLTIDHIVPLSKGGTDDLCNLQFLCRHHNSRKGAQIAQV